MQKRSKRFALIGIVALVFCLAAALMAVTGCSPEPEKKTSEPVLAPQEKEPTVDKKVQLPTEPFYVMITGNDSWEGTIYESNGEARTDTMMLTRVDPVNHQVTIASIPRDTQTWVDDEPAKINTAYYYGMDSVLDQVEGLTGVRPQYYFDMGFADFVHFIDDLGGIDINVPVDMGFEDYMSGNYVDLAAGEQHLDGASALVFARVRKIFAEDMEACRQMDDRSIVETTLNYIANNPDKIDKAVDALYKYADTNWDKDQFKALVEDFAANKDKMTILSGTGPYDGDIYGDTGAWMAIRDEDTWAAIIEAMNNGGSPQDVVALPNYYVG